MALAGSKTYIGFIVLGLIGIAQILEWLSPTMANTLYSIVAPATGASLRSGMKSKGYKTYAGCVASGVLGMLVTYGVVTQDVFLGMMSVVGTFTGVSMRQGLKKSS